MAQNRQPELKPNHSSSSEEEEEEEEASGSEDEQTSCSESEEVSDSDSQEKQKQEPKKPVIAAPQSAKKPQAPDLSSSGTEGSDSDTDSDSPPKKPVVADPTIKPISSKPMEREEGTNPESKSAKKSGSRTSSTPSPAKTGKRPPPATAPAIEKDSKKAKKSTAADEDSKKQLFQRLWSEDDEIVILKGMIDYKTEKNGENPVADMGAFHEFIKKSLHVDVSRAQLVDKVRRLKKKYVNNASREKNGKDRSFSKSHEQKGYELSKLIWGSNSHTSGTESKKTQNHNPAKGNAASTSSGVALLKANGVEMEKEVSTMEVEKNMDVSRFVQYGRNNDCPILQEEIVKAGLELVEASKREELEEKWKKLKKQELQLYVMRMELLKEQSALVYEAINSSGN
ncbi:STOREKEEPER protein-like [Cynara cardunculus var. scolymus]|uniref:Uncharacterized protein n=1 Tax=Cynara cardunculus var. scolymus TaxID=59895 RepID=A0A103Y104_CYNCS|nr:STOREKEEPER protein-like [Cynara cardunculus var. scolymus]KVI00534.1 Protein of unknown function DUF573 [Cynara cardunculus var. scolymus]